MTKLVEALESRRMLAAFDPTFGRNGITAFGQETAQPTAVVPLADGNVFLAMQTVNAEQMGLSYSIARLNAHGSLDRSFGASGMAFTELRDDPSKDGLAFLDLVEQSGKPLALVSNYSGARYHLDLVRFSASGVLDRTFGTSGRVRISVDNPAFSGSLRVLEDGRIEAASDDGDRLVIARFGPDGEPDLTLGPRGVKTVK